jgi:hypothetical protein
MPFHTFIQQERIYILPELLRRHGIVFEDISQGAESMLVLFPNTYYASYNKGKSFTVSTTYDMEIASEGRTAIPTRSSRHEARKSLKRVSAELATKPYRSVKSKLLTETSHPASQRRTPTRHRL